MRTIPKLRYAIWWPVVASLACAEPPPASPGPVLDLPPRPADADNGHVVAAELRLLEVEAREDRIYDEIASGNVPPWLREMRPVEWTPEVDGRERSVTFWVTPDYLAVGSDSLYFRVPLSPATAQRVADLVGAALPTPSMVDLIWAAADVRLDPIRLAPNEFMRTVPYFVRHDRLVEAQRKLYDIPLGSFAAGQKLDVVVLSPADPEEREVALYGWHRSSGEPIQQVYPVLTDNAPAFSHGVRLVDRTVRLDGQPTALSELLRDAELGPLLGGASDG